MENPFGESALCVEGIPDGDWQSLRDQLAAEGWTLQRGGGLDHSWARLSKDALEIHMEYDIWREGWVGFPSRRKADILAALPDWFVRTHGSLWGPA